MLAPYSFPRSYFIPNGDPNMSSNILINVIVLITVKSWCEKVRIVRIIVEVVFVPSRTKFLFSGYVKILTLILFSWGLYFILSEGSD
jgi:hypothetical protein